MKPGTYYTILTKSAAGNWYAQEHIALTIGDAADELAEALKPHNFTCPSDFAVHRGTDDMTQHAVAVLVARLDDRYGETIANEMLEGLCDPLSAYVAAYAKGRADGQDFFDNWDKLARLGRAIKSDLGALEAI